MAFKPLAIVNDKPLMNCQVQSLKDRLSASEGPIGFDTEATSLDYTKRMVGFSLAWREKDSVVSCYVPTSHATDRQRAVALGSLGKSHELFSSLEDRRAQSDLDANPNVTAGAQLLGELVDATKGRTWVMHNAKYDLGVLINEQIDPSRFSAVYDTYLAAWVLLEGRLGLKALAKRFFDVDMTEYSSFALYKKQARLVPAREMAPYAAADAHYTLLLYERFEQMFARSNSARLRKVFTDLALPGMFDLLAMEDTGFKVDRAGLQNLAYEFEAETQQLVVKMAKLLKVPVSELNINSPMWLSDTLVDSRRWWYVSTNAVRGKNGAHTMRKEDIADWASGGRRATPEGKEFAESLLRYRTLAKLNSTYTHSLLALADPNDRVHSSFNQTGAATGRLSSSEPNLQNIPIRSPEGKRIRGAFITDPGWALIVRDYSQIELRVLAHLSRDAKMIKTYEDGGDIHQLTADQVGCTRSQAKTVNFGIIYGMGPNKLAAAIAVPVTVAAEYIEAYFDNLPGVADYMRRMKEFVREYGYVETLLGRRRYLPEIYSNDRGERAGAERKAGNTPIQGSASDIITVALRNINRRLRRENVWLTDARVISQVHDELISEAKIEFAPEADRIIKEEMENAVKLRVPLIAEGGIYPNWGAAK